MTEYDFLVLSPNEFEDFSRDILQEKNGIFIESFKTGRDGGIDLRYSIDKSKEVIIQAKRYSSYANLISNLKKEVPKVKKLNPKKYIITTTLGLTPKNKDEIKKLFHPFILNTEDILAKDDLNNLISIHKNIENKYYKLWISSTNILNKVLHSKIYNQTAFELDEIKSQIKLYVQNNSFNQALETLNKHRYIIISGIPGIGKTTLSRILIIYLLSNEFDEFVYLSDNIDEGYKFYKEGSKQIFFFDDFLGKNFFDAKDLPKNDDKIVKFIQRIKQSSDKVLIFATREYILNQAKLTYESFEISNIELAKCIIDLSTYTSLIKAKILYNHLYYGDVPISHIENLIEDKRYLILINHKNYSPRIIETIINRKIWNDCLPEHFFNALKEYFDNPQSVWLFAFENSLDRFSQYVLMVLASIGTPILLDDLQEAIKKFLTINNYKYLISFDSIKFNRAIKELENTFIKTTADSLGKISVEYQNPSIYDFIIHYLNGKNDVIESILLSSLYIEQFFTIFTSDKKDIAKVKLNQSLIKSAVKRIIQLNDDIKSVKLVKYTIKGTEKFQWSRQGQYLYKFLNNIRQEFIESNKQAEDYVYENFQKHIYREKSYFSYSENNSYIELLENLDHEKLDINDERLLDHFLETSTWLDDIEYFEKLEYIFPVTFQDTINSSNFIEKIQEIVDFEFRNIELEEAADLKDRIEAFQDKYGIDFNDVIIELNAKEKQLDSYIDDQINMGMEKDYRDNEPKYENENIAIDEIFNSLKE